MTKLEELEAKLADAIKLCERYSKPAHMVGNCLSDVQDRDMAWRKRQGLEFQIRELKRELLASEQHS